MSNVIKMYGENSRAERLIGQASDGGIEICVDFNDYGNDVLFNVWKGQTPNPAGIAAMIEIASRFKTDVKFREAVEHYCIQIGSSVQSVEKPAWKFRLVGTGEYV